MIEQASEIKVGMTADEVLKMRGRSEDHATANPKVMAADGDRLVVEWSYADCVVVLRHDGNRYGVSEVRDA